MADEPNPDYREFTGAFVPFDAAGLLGAGTNGAPPDTALGLRVEVEILHTDGNVTEWYALRPVTEVTPNGEVVGSQNFLYTDDRRAFGRLLSTMYDVLSRGTTGGVVGEGFEGRRNWAQEDHDPEVPTDQNIVGLRAVVGRSGAGHLEVSLERGDDITGRETVARLDGHMTQAAKAFRATMDGMTRWARDAREAMDERAEEHRTASSPSP